MKKLLVLFAVLIVVCVAFVPLFGAAVAVAESTSTEAGVLEDLQRDPNFDASEYPSGNSGRDLSLITIAETSDQQLVLYVYQSNASIKYYAKSVRMSTRVSDNQFEDTTDYSLRCLDRNGVFYKYLVIGYHVSDDPVRHYNIVQLMRNFVSGVDAQSRYDNSINAVPYIVSKQFVFEMKDGVLTNTESGFDVVTITDKFVGFVRIKSRIDSMTAGGTGDVQFRYDDSYFIAFNCDHDMDRLIEAKVSFFKQDSRKLGFETSIRYGIGVKYVKYVHDDVDFTLESDPGSWDRLLRRMRGQDETETYTWNEIQTADAFMQSTNRETIYQGLLLNTHVFNRIGDTEAAIIDGMTWVLNFEQTQSWFRPGMLDFSNEDYTNYLAQGEFEFVTNVSILELTFEHAGETFQLGVVDGEATPSSSPSNESGIDIVSKWKDAGFGDLWKTVLSIAGIVLAVLVVFVVIVKVSHVGRSTKNDEVRKD